MFSSRLLEEIERAKAVAVLTGAGVSAESGVPTFRGDDGLWKKFKPEELANFDAFIRNPQLVWEWYSYRKKLISEVEPNPGHYALVKMEDYFPEFTLITQNVDGLHQRAGSQRVVELHGNILRNRCIRCNRIYTDPQIPSEEIPPKCQCGGLIRPDVVWFGEPLPEEELTLAFQASENCDLFFSIGTSAVVQPAASLPLIAKRSGAYVVEINPESTPISDVVDESIRGKSGEVLPKLVERMGCH